MFFLLLLYLKSVFTQTSLYGFSFYLVRDKESWSWKLCQSDKRSGGYTTGVSYMTKGFIFYLRLFFMIVPRLSSYRDPRTVEILPTFGAAC